jgi:hypothetical protein
LQHVNERNHLAETMLAIIEHGRSRK